jgi:hypothetical protein
MYTTEAEMKAWDARIAAKAKADHGPINQPGLTSREYREMREIERRERQDYLDYINDR